MLQLALRQQQLHAAHMQIKLQHQTHLVIGEHNVQTHHIQHKQQQEPQQRATLFGVDQLGSPAPARGPLPAASDELNVAACLSATSTTWRTHHEPHTPMATTVAAQTTLTTVDQRPLQAVTQVFQAIIRFVRSENCR